MVAFAGGYQLVPEDHLRRVAFTRVAYDDKAEIVGPGNALGFDGKDLVRGYPASQCVLLDILGHACTPFVDPDRGDPLPNARRPVLRIEIPTETPDGIHRDQNGGQRQADTQQPPERKID